MLDDVPDEHAELGAPVADVVLADHAVAFELQQPAEAVADDRAAEMADVHLFGDVRTGEIDDDGLGRGGRSNAEALAVLVRDAEQFRGHVLRLQSQVDEPRSGHFRRLAQVAHIEQGDHGFRELAGVGLELLGQGHHAVGLVIAKPRIGRRPDDSGAARLAGRFGHRGGDSFFEDIYGGFHVVNCSD